MNTAKTSKIVGRSRKREGAWVGLKVGTSTVISPSPSENTKSDFYVSDFGEFRLFGFPMEWMVKPDYNKDRKNYHRNKKRAAEMEKLLNWFSREMWEDNRKLTSISIG